MRKTLRRWRRTVMFGTRLLLIGAMVGIFLLGWLWFYYGQHEERLRFYFNGFAVMLLIYGAVFTAFATIYSAFKIGTLRITEVVYSTGLALVFSNAIGYLQFSLFALRMLSPLPMVGITAVQMAVATLILFWTNKIYFAIYPARELAMICHDRQQALALARKVNLVKEKYHVCRVISQEEGQAAIDGAVRDFNTLMLYRVDEQVRGYILDRGFAEGKRVYIIPDAHDIMLNTAGITQIFDTPVLLCKNSIMTTEQGLLKRGVDLFCSALGLLLASPLMLLVALCIKLEDGGPVLFRQQRLTLHNKVFWLYKFRSMVPDAEKDGVARLSQKEDSRVTRIGRVIRATRLDELPQLFNILRGDMSLVGPRPERPEIAVEYIRQIPDFRYRTRMKAGLTGYAQIYGKYNTTPQDKLLLDLLYIENYSLLLDFKLLLLTLKIVFMPESTEGVDSDQTTAQK